MGHHLFSHGIPGKGGFHGYPPILTHPAGPFEIGKKGPYPPGHGFGIRIDLQSIDLMPDKLIGPAVDSDDNIYVADTLKSRVQKFCPALPGDTNRDCVVDEDDFVEIEDYMCEPADECPSCDLDKDGMITPDDARLLVEQNPALKILRRGTARLYRYYPDCGVVMFLSPSAGQTKATI